MAVLRRPALGETIGGRCAWGKIAWIGEDGRSTGRKDDLEPTAFSKRESPRGAGERPRAEPVFEPRGLKAHRRRGQVKRQLPDRLPLSTTVTKTVVA